MSTTDPGLNSPTTVGSRPNGAPAPTGVRGEHDVRQGGAPRSAQTRTGQARGEQSRPGQVFGPQARQTTGRGDGRPVADRSSTAEPVTGQPRPGQTTQPRGAQAPSGQLVTAPGRTGQPRQGQPRPGQVRPGQARPGRPGAGPVRRGPRKARLSLARLDPWSVLKLSFLGAVALGIIGVVVTAVVWNVIDGMGVFTDIDEIVSQVNGDDEFRILDFVGRERMLSLSVVLSVANVVILTALATLFAFVYNISSGLVGGLHVTLTDE